MLVRACKTFLTKHHIVFQCLSWISKSFYPYETLSIVFASVEAENWINCFQSHRPVLIFLPLRGTFVISVFRSAAAAQTVTLSFSVLLCRRCILSKHWVNCLFVVDSRWYPSCLRSKREEKKPLDFFQLGYRITYIHAYWTLRSLRAGLPCKTLQEEGKTWRLFFFFFTVNTHSHVSLLTLSPWAPGGPWGPTLPARPCRIEKQAKNHWH